MDIKHIKQMMLGLRKKTGKIIEIKPLLLSKISRHVPVCEEMLPE